VSSAEAFRPVAAGIAFSLLSAACGGARPSPAEPSAPPADTAATAPPEPAASASAPDVSDNAPPAQDAPPSEAQPELGPPELCQKMCDRLKERCSADSVEKCRGNCREWNSPPPGCETEVKRALQCAIDAEDLQCVNIMPSSCTKRFKQIEACASGKKSDAPEMSLDMPSGWQRFESKEGGYSVPMPPGVEAKQVNGENVASASVGAVLYSVRVLPAPPPGKKDLLVAQGVLGDCIKKLQLKGLIERPERRSLEFKAGCSSGREASGVFVTVGQRLYVVSVTGPSGAMPNRDVFVYGFKAGP
jgi:hypothetical protein